MPKKAVEESKQVVSLDQKEKLVKVAAFKMDNEIVFNFFDKMHEDYRDAALLKAIYIGVLALMEDRLSTFLSKTESELGVHLESLKMIFDMKRLLFYKSTMKGTEAEDNTAAFLNEYFKSRGWKDEARPTGTTGGKIDGNKTGDILCSIEGTARTIAIEVKYDKAYAIGDIQDKDPFAKKETTWGQILEAKANRDSAVGIMVFDKSISKDLAREIDSVAFIRGVGLVAMVDSLSGNYTNLVIAYVLARDIVLNAKVVDVKDDILAILVKRILWDLGEMKSVRDNATKIQKASQEILAELDKRTLSMRFTMEYLAKFLKDGVLSKEDLFAFYSGDAVKTRYEALKIKDLAEPPKE